MPANTPHPPPGTRGPVFSSRNHSRAGKGSRRTSRRSQRALFCPCGAPFPASTGLCRACYGRSQHSARYFGGNRERALEEDAGRCRACGDTRVLHVHHRRAGDHGALVTLCAACHARIHRTRVWRRSLPELLGTLWREWHPRDPEQLQLPLTGSVGESSARPAGRS